jgi:hypothetical protein
MAAKRGKIMTMKVVNRNERWIDYRLNILGIRVWESACQLIAKGAGEWSTIGPRWDLPVQVPQTPEELKAAVSDTVRLTAYQYVSEKPGSDLADLLARRRDFEAALQASDAAIA